MVRVKNEVGGWVVTEVVAVAEVWVLGLMGFACRGSWVCGFCSPLYPLPLSLPLTVKLLSLKFSLVFVVVVVVVFFFFFFLWLAMGLIFG